jgi:hypothetical protein
MKEEKKKYGYVPCEVPVIAEVKERAFVTKAKKGVKKDQLQRDGVVRRQTKWIARAIESPVVTAVFGEYLSPFCHSRPDLEGVKFTKKR